MYAKPRFLIFLLTIVFSLSIAAFADTIRLKDGTTIKGKVIGFKDQQFTILIGDGSRNRRSQLTVYIEDVESIEFDDSANPLNRVITGNQPASDNASNTASNNRSENQTPPTNTPTTNPNVTVTNNTQRQPSTSGSLSQVINSQPPTSGNTSSAARGRFIVVRGANDPLKVTADATANGWTNAGYVVKKGQRVRISATGRVSLGSGRFATPAGVGSIADEERLMKTEPTGALIAVIGDDNNEFIFIGSSREFVAQRDGTLFLGVNEGNLDDNSGAFDAVIEVEAADSTTSRR